MPVVDPRPLRERIADLGLEQLEAVEAGDRLYHAGLTDGLPVVPPTAARIEAMLGGANPGEYAGLGPIPPGFMTPTPWDAAVCAVLAGCDVGALPVVLAGLAAVADPAFNLLGIQTTTGAAATLFIVNGPIVQTIGLNPGHNALGPGWRSNATIGRAIRLVLHNVGLAVPGTGDMATQGHPGKYTWLVAENEAGSPWPAFQTTRGFAPEDSTVTAVGAVGNVEVVLPLSSPEAMVQTMARSMTIGGNIGHGYFGSGQPLVLLPPEAADFLTRHGWDRGRFQHDLWHASGVPLAWLPDSAAERVTTARARIGLSPEDDVRAARTVEDILVVVTGGVGIKATFIPTWAGGTEAVTRPIARD